MDVYIPYEKTVKEIKAPTDESVKLLNEMSEEVIKNIMHEYKVENTNIDTAILIHDDPKRRMKVVVLKIVVNGEERIYSTGMNDVSIIEEGVEIFQLAIFDLVKDAVTDIVSGLVVENMTEYNKLFKRF